MWIKASYAPALKSATLSVFLAVRCSRTFFIKLLKIEVKAGKSKEVS